MCPEAQPATARCSSRVSSQRCLVSKTILGRVGLFPSSRPRLFARSSSAGIGSYTGCATASPSASSNRPGSPPQQVDHPAAPSRWPAPQHAVQSDPGAGPPPRRRRVSPARRHRSSDGAVLSQDDQRGDRPLVQEGQELVHPHDCRVGGGDRVEIPIQRVDTNQPNVFPPVLPIGMLTTPMPS